MRSDYGRTKKSKYYEKRLSGNAARGGGCVCLRKCGAELTPYNIGEQNFRASMQYVYNHSLGATPYSLR